MIEKIKPNAKSMDIIESVTVESVTLKPAESRNEDMINE